jgi:2-methylisocitrate lyase-like PEP mutase family enzyme
VAGRRHRGGNGERNGERHEHAQDQRLAQAQPLLAPGVYDALTALVAEQAGFEALYLSGASIAYTRLGRSDVGLTTATEVQDTLARITERVDVPVIVDADTGFGNALNVQRTVRGLRARRRRDDPARGPGLPEALRPPGRQDRRARRRDVRQAARRARCAPQPETLILARTDALAVEGLEAAFERAEAYLACGVDALFIEALRTREQMDAACAASRRVPLLANMVEGGKTPCQRQRTGRARLSHRHLPRRHRARGGAHAAGLLREPEAARQHDAMARAHARLRRPQCGDRHADWRRGRGTTGPRVRVDRVARSRADPRRSTQTHAILRRRSLLHAERPSRPPTAAPPRPPP